MNEATFKIPVNSSCNYLEVNQNAHVSCDFKSRHTVTEPELFIESLNSKVLHFSRKYPDFKSLILCVFI